MTLVKVKEESEKVGLKLNIQKTKIMASGPLTSWEIDGETVSPSVLTTKLNATAAAKSLQSCPTLCDPRDSSPPGSPIPGILQARTLEWVAISFSLTQLQIQSWGSSNLSAPIGSQAAGTHLLSFYETFMFL